MGLFSNRRKKAEQKEAARQAEIARAAEELRRQQEASAQLAKKAALAKEDEKQEMIVGEMRKLKEKINIWEKKVLKLEADKNKLMRELLPYKQKGVALPQPLMKKLTKVDRDLKLTQSQLETLENKLSGIEQAHANDAVVSSVAEGNVVLEDIKPSIEKVEDVLGKADEQAAELEEASNAFLVSSAQTANYDEDDIMAALDDFAVINDLEPAAKEGQASTHVSALPAPPSIQPAPVAAASSSTAPPSADTEDAAEAEMRRLEQSMAAV